jgi:hypothetical protein
LVQTVSDDAPVTFEYLPAPQSTQALAPVMVEYFPGLHD